MRSSQRRTSVPGSSSPAATAALTSRAAVACSAEPGTIRIGERRHQRAERAVAVGAKQAREHDREDQRDEVVRHQRARQARGAAGVRVHAALRAALAALRPPARARAPASCIVRAGRAVPGELERPLARRARPSARAARRRSTSRRVCSAAAPRRRRPAGRSRSSSIDSGRPPTRSATLGVSHAAASITVRHQPSADEAVRLHPRRAGAARPCVSSLTWPCIRTRSASPRAAISASSSSPVVAVAGDVQRGLGNGARARRAPARCACSA